MCSEIIPPRFNDQISPVLSFLRELLSVADGDKPDGRAILSRLQLVIFLDHSSELYKVLAEEGVYLRIIEFLLLDFIIIAMILGNLAPCGKAKKQIIIDTRDLFGLKWLLGQTDKLILKEACWIIGNLVGGTRNHLQNKLNKFDTRYEAAWAIYTFSCGSFKQTRYLPQLEVIGCVRGLFNLMTFTNEPKLLDVCLNGLSNFLIHGNMLRKKSTINVYAEDIKNGNTIALLRLWSLKNHNNENISYLAGKIFEEYWSSENVINSFGNVLMY
ncbi:importin subunit alpha-4-like [Vicia villosa]|uniref:importin subunit alpha-4-like n=1 Tax=Vicia villosa TaxID=3911 RepID=UPI00273CD02C|nr:importin subunit alpha-4-like [Vicia villosa]